MYELKVPEDHNINENIVSLELRDNDEIQNKEPIFTISSQHSSIFKVDVDPDKNGVLLLKQVGGFLGSTWFSIMYFVCHCSDMLLGVWDYFPFFYQALDYETTKSYTFTVHVRENLKNLGFAADNENTAVTATEVKQKTARITAPQLL